MRSSRLVTVLVGLWSAVAMPVAADEWGSFVYMSAIASNTVGHLCAGVPAGFMHYFDIQCPSNAPYVSSTSGYMGIGTDSPSVALEVSGTVSATQYVGDGSGLTGIRNTSVDRIVSTTANIVVGNGGTVSFSTGGVSGTAYLDTYGRMVLPGISTTTNQVSFTTGYFSANVGIGTAAPTLGALHLLQRSDAITNGLAVQNAATTGSLRMWVDGSGKGRLDVNGGNNGDFAINGAGPGKIGINTTSPNATLQVSGSFTVSTSAQTTTPSLYVSSTSGYVGIGTSAPSTLLTVAGPGLAIVTLSTTDVTVNTRAAYSAYSDADNFAFIAHSSARTLSRFGLTLGGWAEINLQNQGGGTANGIVIGTTPAVPIVFGTNNSERMRILASGNVGINTSSPNAKLDVNGTISATAVYVTGTTGTVSATYGYFQYVSASSIAVGGSSLLTGAGSAGYVPYWIGNSGLTYDSTAGGQL